MIIQVRLKDNGRVYYSDPGTLEVKLGDMVIVETSHGLEMARVIALKAEESSAIAVEDLQPVVRRALPDDFARMKLLEQRRDRVLNICAKKIKEHGLPMRLVKAEYNFDGSRLTFFFTADLRVDFRLLVRDLAALFKTRIELRQIGPREKARLLGGIGICGRPFCCSTFCHDCAQPNLRMARDQDLPLNTAKISGGCNRLLCCLTYEHQQYQELRKGLPSYGAIVQTPDGPGEVVQVNVLDQSLIVQLSSSGMQELYRMAHIGAVVDDAQDNQHGPEVSRLSYRDSVDPVEQANQSRHRRKKNPNQEQ